MTVLFDFCGKKKSIIDAPSLFSSAVPLAVTCPLNDANHETNISSSITVHNIHHNHSSSHDSQSQKLCQSVDLTLCFSSVKPEL